MIMRTDQPFPAEAEASLGRSFLFKPHRVTHPAHDWNSSQHRVHVVLTRAMQSDGTVSITQPLLCREAHVKMTNVRYYLHDLEQRRIISRVNAPKSRPAVWKVLVPAAKVLGR